MERRTILAFRLKIASRDKKEMFFQKTFFAGWLSWRGD